MTMDKKWFGDMVRIYQKELYRLAFHILKNKEDAEDALQETLYRAYSHLGQLKNPEYFKTWMVRILLNTAFEMQKKRKNNLDLDEYNDVIGKSEDITTKIMLETVIREMDEKYQYVIFLYYYENYSVKEISEILNVSVMNVKQRLSRSRKILKEKLSERGKGV